MKKWIKTVIAIVMSALTLFGAVACGKVETPQFIKEYLCVEHTYGVGVIERKATCNREGRVKYTCSECGNEKVEVTARSAHVPYTVPARAATCAQTGYSEHTACATCGQTLEGKVTTPKTACLHENDYYAGMGVYACPLCDDARTEHRELEVESPNDVVIDSSRNAWYRFYLPNESSKASITFENRVMNEPMGNFEINEIYQLTFEFSLETLQTQGNYIRIGNGVSLSYWSDAEIEFGPDYIDICLGHIDFELYHEECMGGCEFTLDSYTVKVSDVSMSGGAKIVILQGMSE